MSTDDSDKSLPWIPVTGEDYTSGTILPLLALVLASTALIVALELADRLEKREKLRRYCLARHRILRAEFYQFFRRD